MYGHVWVRLTEFCCIGLIIIRESSPKSLQKQYMIMTDIASQVDHCHESTTWGPLKNRHWHNFNKKHKAKEFEMIVVRKFLYTKVEVLSVQSLWCSDISRHSICSLFCSFCIYIHSEFQSGESYIHAVFCSPRTILSYKVLISGLVRKMWRWVYWQGVISDRLVQKPVWNIFSPYLAELISFMHLS